MYTIEQKLALVQAYIFHRKEVEVQINVANIYEDVFEQMKLSAAYEVAVQWFKDNGGKANFL